MFFSADVMVHPAGVTLHCSPNPHFGDTSHCLSQMCVDNALWMLVMKDWSDVDVFTVAFTCKLSAMSLDFGLELQQSFSFIAFFYASSGADHL